MELEPSDSALLCNYLIDDLRDQPLVLRVSHEKLLPTRCYIGCIAGFDRGVELFTDFDEMFVGLGLAHAGRSSVNGGLMKGS